MTLRCSRPVSVLLPKGRRRQALEKAFARLLEEDLENRVLDFDSAAATEAAALARRAMLATRNARHFADLKVPVVDPWEARA